MKFYAMTVCIFSSTAKTSTKTLRFLAFTFALPAFKNLQLYETPGKDINFCECLQNSAILDDFVKLDS
jgi:hypothetical protein